MPTKEEIAKKWVPCRCDEVYTKRKMTAPDCPFHTTDPEEAMDEWAKEKAIAFNRFISDSYYHEGQAVQKGMWFDMSGECVAETTEQLYEIFNQQNTGGITP